MQSDVNTVSFADESGNLIYSGSDDNLCKVKRFFVLDYLLYILETVQVVVIQDSGGRIMYLYGKTFLRTFKL